MEKKTDLVEETKALTTSLDNTQKNAANTDSLVKHVGTLSGQTTYEQIINGIMADEATDWKTKVSLIQEINSDYDRREEHNTRRVRKLQASQAKNTDKGTRSWGRTIGWIAAYVFCTLFLNSPQGQNMIASAKRRLLPANS